jgi:uncharacterized protein YndB with AHSA1/START domain
MKHAVSHKTVSLRKKVDFSIQKVFKAFASQKARSEWSVPKGDAIEYIEDNFSVGGKDVFRCGSPDSMEFNGVVQYEDIVKNRRIIYTETIKHKKKKLSVALLTLNLVEIEGATEITVTAQVCSLDGANMSLGYKQGWTAVLKNLEEFLSQ